MRSSWVIAVVIAVSAGAARADDPRRAAEQLYKDAERSQDEVKYVACGNAYFDIYNANSAAPDNDEVLYTGATCFQLGKSIGGALQAYELVLKYYPKSKLAPKALLQTATLYARIARFDQAADRFERYAMRYAGEKDARDAIENAVMLRTAIGDTAKRIEDTKLFVRTFGAKAPKEAAEAMFALAGAYETPDDQVKALREFIRTYGAKADRWRVAVAYGRIGDALWRQSCPITSVDGLCVKYARDKGTSRCSPNVMRVDTVARTAAVKKEALEAYDQAIKLVEQAGLTDPAAVHVAAMAKIARADDDLERMFAKTFPSGLDFDPAPEHKAAKQASLKRFNDWIADETKTGQDLTRGYESALTMKDPSASIAAAARIGQTSYAFARALAVAEIPKDVRTGDFAKDKTQAYCDALDQAAAPLAAHAADAFAVCVDKAMQLGVYDEWVGLCRREGQLLDPKRFPPAEVQPELSLPLVTATERPVKAAPDLAAALAKFAANEQAGWTDKTCKQSADAFVAVANKSKASAADAYYMVGLSFHRCGLVDAARDAYQQALHTSPDHAAALSNLGELAWRAGQVDAAKQSWERALKVNGKLFAARVDLAIALYDQLRVLPPRDPKRKQLVSDAEFQATNALALDADPLPFVVLAMITADGGDKHKLDLARAYLDQAQQIDDKRGSVYIARAALAARRGEWTLAGASAERAVAVEPHSDDALRAAGLLDARVGRFDSARSRLSAVKVQRYDVLVARGIAARALGNGRDAEAFYQKAIQADPARAEAHYDLGLFYELHAQPPVPARAIEEYRRAAAIDSSLDAIARISALDKKP
jgi:tetratricopeptide (TPR) repeat protein